MSEDAPISRRDMIRGRVLGPLLGGLRDAAASRLKPLAPEPAPSAAPPEAARAEATSRYAKSFPILRPPGAVEEEAFLAGCTKCNACVEACPYDSIIHAPVRFRRAAGTPMINPVGQPCWMCADAPCIASCEPGVLRFDLPMKIGVARIDETTCLPWMGTTCTVCSEQCPVPGAIEVRAGRPRIIEETCTGCGVCQHVCPAPGNAVILMPLAQRPPAPPAPPADGRGATPASECNADEPE